MPLANTRDGVIHALPIISTIRIVERTTMSSAVAPWQVLSCMPTHSRRLHLSGLVGLGTHICVGLGKHFFKGIRPLEHLIKTTGGNMYATQKIKRRHNRRVVSVCK